nr:reverse transcriptase domain-containing protein [Tanacetum cinerariifolium]
TTAFIRGEAAAANKKKGHMSWKPQDQLKKHTDKRPDFQSHPRDGRGANRFTPLTRTPKEILAAEANKFQPLPPMVTPVEKRNGKAGIITDEKEARKIRLKARQYELMEGILYKRSFLTPWLRCVGPLQAEYVIKEIHEGSCSMHAGPRSVVAKAIRLGYFWPTMHKDAQDMIRKCNDCQ